MITATFTDPQGQTWADAKLKVIDHTVGQNKQITVNHDASNMGNPQVNESESINASMQVAYWPSQASVDAGAAPYLLANMGNSPASTYFYFTPITMPADVVALELLCEEHLTGVILPPMQA